MIELTKSNEEMAEVFSEVALFFETIVSPIDMREAWIGDVKVINSEYCSTPACVGSWLTYYYCDKPGAKYRGHYPGETKGLPPILWEIGAKCLTEELGIEACAEDLEDLEDLNECSALIKWAKDNPEIWGNKFGECMFYSGEAYLPENYCSTSEDIKITAKHIAQHFAGVAERLRSIPWWK